MAFKVSVDGRDALRRLRTAVPAAIHTSLEPVLRAGAQAVAADARSCVPVLTGTLRRGITSGGSGLTYVAGVSGPAEPYAHYVEYGTSDQMARPFMRTGARREADRMPGRVRTIAAKLPREVAR
jgi:HK97 gp10 family phage protein